MNRTTIAGLVAMCAAIIVLATYAAKEKESVDLWTNPEKAVVESPAFGIQGEYVGENAGVQVVALDSEGNRFYASTWKGGLPGAGWDGSSPTVGEFDKQEIQKKLEGLSKEVRRSPSLGKAPPKGSLILFDGSENDQIEGKISDSTLWAGSRTTKKFGDFKIHVEFRTPFKPGAEPGDQDRGNSGLYLLNLYEIQILDSFGLPMDREKHGLKSDFDPKRWCGSLYESKLAEVNMCLPPLAWQTYDIDFTAAKFDENGKKTSNARITVYHNGVIIHDDVELEHGTGSKAGRTEVEEGRIQFQGHGNPVAFRNVWIVTQS